MREHFENLKYLYGREANVRIPNSIFKTLSGMNKDENNNVNAQQIAFSYAYILTVSFLYKYCHFVDVENHTYVQNGDIKSILGYSRKTKSVDKLIKKGGLLDQLQITNTIKNYPVRSYSREDEKINGVSLLEFVCIDDSANDINYNSYRSLVKNRNYEVKEPLFMTTDAYGENDYGTLYSFENTHSINIHEFLSIVFSDDLDNTDLMLYCYIKSKCKGYKNNLRAITLYKILLETGISNRTFYCHLKKLKKKKYISVNHSGWVANRGGNTDHQMSPNEYIWRGI